MRHRPEHSAAGCPKTLPKQARIIGLDASPGMLKVAEENLRAVSEGLDTEGNRVLLGVHDLLTSSESGSSSLPGPLKGRLASGVISTLVLEYIPVDTIFQGAAMVLRPGGYLLVTNMYAEMGKTSHAGFVDVFTGTNIRPKSYTHEIKDVLAAAKKAGFEIVPLVGGKIVREARVDAAMVERLGGRAKKWVGVTVWFGIRFKMRAQG